MSLKAGRFRDPITFTLTTMMESRLRPELFLLVRWNQSAQNVSYVMSWNIHNLINHLQLLGLWIKAQGLGQGRAPGRPSPRAARPRAESTWSSALLFSTWYIGNTSLCVASPEQANSHSCGVIYHGEQGYNIWLTPAKLHFDVDLDLSYLGHWGESNPFKYPIHAISK